MFLRCVIAFGLLAWAGLAGGCATSPKIEPKGQVVVPLPTSDEKLRVTVKLLNEVVLTLPPLTTPGTEWTLVANDGRFLKPWKPIAFSADRSSTTSFVAIRVGRRAIRFFALPPHDREADPTQAYDVVVTIE